MKNGMKLFLSSVILIGFYGSYSQASGHHDSESNKPSGSGHCVYMSDNPFAGDPYKACRTNVSESFCASYPDVGDGMVTIMDPVYAEGDCPREGSIGSCERGGWEEVYYEDSNTGPMGVEFGCNFAGEWLTP